MHSAENMAAQMCRFSLFGASSLSLLLPSLARASGLCLIRGMALSEVLSLGGCGLLKNGERGCMWMGEAVSLCLREFD